MNSCNVWTRPAPEPDSNRPGRRGSNVLQTTGEAGITLHLGTGVGAEVALRPGWGRPPLHRSDGSEVHTTSNLAGEISLRGDAQTLREIRHHLVWKPEGGDHDSHLAVPVHEQVAAQPRRVAAAIT